MANEQSRERWSVPEDWSDKTPSLEEPAEIPFHVERQSSTLEPTGIGQAAKGDGTYGPEPVPAESEPSDFALRHEITTEPLLFQYYEAPRPPRRIPNYADLLLLMVFLFLGILCAIAGTQFAIHKHLFGVGSAQQASTDIHFTLGSEIVLYFFTLFAGLAIFPLVWHKGFFAGLQWNGGTAFRLRFRLVTAAFACLLLAAASSLLSPGPANAPIDKVFKAPGAAWPLFAFGVTIAPFFEEMLFRGFLLPTLCTISDWTDECLFGRPNVHLSPVMRNFYTTLAMSLVSVIAVAAPIAIAYSGIHHSAVIFLTTVGVSAAVYFGLRAIRPETADQFVLPLSRSGHPQWSFAAMAVGSIVASIPFAMLHAEQTGYSIGPFVLLAGVSMVLCAVRLSTRSLASSTLVHACYNFVLFSVMLIGTHGFSHLDKM